MDAVQSFLICQCIFFGVVFTSEVSEQIKVQLLCVSFCFQGWKTRIQLHCRCGLALSFATGGSCDQTFCFIGPVWSFWQGDLDVLYSFSPCKFWPLLEELVLKAWFHFSWKTLTSYSQQEPFLTWSQVEVGGRVQRHREYILTHSAAREQPTFEVLHVLKKEMLLYATVIQG